MISIEEIKDLMKTLDASSLQRLEIKNGDCSLTIEKGSDGKAMVAAPPAQRWKQEIRSGAMVEIKAPMVGTFYAAADPEAEPFVEVGSAVNPDTVVCVLEAMKLFTEVTADCGGEIAEILVKNGDFVEYGQSLFRVKV
ncbi:biotin carboxyl carrier protein [Selenomonas sp. WCT3]|uniref:acetyl-CoA carboxylase biotin carboxyl carrier protein n=1 Tax=Selenomonas sp. WCT3 TaxID=3158785 RepID=UPI00088807AE|nr:biotin carboxyl carrier protein [Selenomonas ruminantium]